jgi:hypothetical protein
MSQISLKPPRLPLTNSELIAYLDGSHRYEIRQALLALREATAKSMKSVIVSWFRDRPLELDSTVLNKIVNASLTPGSIGKDRTVKALSKLNFDSSMLVQYLDKNKAAGILRSKFSSSRSAKIYLDNQTKCINTILKFALSQDDSPKRIKNAQDFSKWSETVLHKWKSQTLLKNAGLYEFSWKIFIGTFDENLLNSQYQLFLEEKIDNLTNSHYQARLESILFDEEIFDSNDQFNQNNNQIDFKVSAGELFYYVHLKNSLAKSENQLKKDLLWALSHHKSFEKLSFIISSISSSSPVLCIRLKNPSDQNTFETLSSYIYNFFDTPMNNKIKLNEGPIEVSLSLFSEARKVGELFRKGEAVLVDMSLLEESERKRAIDFISGLVFSLAGTIERVHPTAFLIQPNSSQSSTNKNGIQNNWAELENLGSNFNDDIRKPKAAG